MSSQGLQLESNGIYGRCRIIFTKKLVHIELVYKRITNGTRGFSNDEYLILFPEKADKIEAIRI
jgi:hypothetical protein